MKKLIVAAAAVAAFGAGTASAAPAGAFNGPFVGVQGGWQQDRLRLDTTDGLGNYAYGRRNADGFAYGGQVGYDLRFRPNFVLGGEVSVTGKTGSDVLVDGFGNATNERYGRTVNATGRVGYVFSTGGLGYVRGGYSNARILLTDPVARNGYNRDGYIVGVGYEQPVARHVSARLEYDYSDYGHGNADAVAADYGLAAGQTRLRRNAVIAGLDFHF